MQRTHSLPRPGSLSFAGVTHIYDETDECYRVVGECRVPALPLTDADAFGQAVATVLSSNEDLGAVGDAKGVTRLLAGSANERARRQLADTGCLVEVLNLQLADHSRCGETVTAIQHALLGLRQLSGVYRSPHEAKPVRLTLHPYRLAFVRQAWYLIGRVEGDEEPKTLRVARFKSLRVLAKPASVPVEFDLRSHFGNAWAVYRGKTTHHVEVWFDPDAAPLVAEVNWHRTQRIEAARDGSAVFHFTVDGLDEIVSWILSWSGRCRVLRPVELKKLVIERLEAAIRMQHLAGE